MEAEARYTYVGAGVVLLLVALVAALLWLKNVGGQGDYNHYTIHFERQALDGLEVGADVTLRGIKVGRVEDYALSGTTLNRVRVEVRIDRRAPVRTNTVAVVTRNFVTGIAAITLVTRAPAGEPLTEVPDGERFPIIGEGRSDLDEIAGRVNKVGEVAAQTLASINELLNPENRADVMSTIRSLRDLSASLNQRMATIDQTLQAAGNAAVRVGEAATEAGRAASELGRAGDRVAGVAEASGQQLQRTLAAADLTLAEARTAVAAVAQAGQAVQEQAVATARKLETTASNVDDQLGAALVEMRLSVEAATRVIDRLREPRSALLGPGKAQLGPGEKLP
jgi:ABC-type transporter Mla subunit MlaD